MVKSKSTDNILETVKEVSIFKPFVNKPEELKIIADIMVQKKIKKGTKIIREGEFGDTLYILRTGAVNILKKTLEKEDYTVIHVVAYRNCCRQFLCLATGTRQGSFVDGNGSSSSCLRVVAKRDYS